MKKSEVLLLIPHYNNPEGLLRSIKSIKEKEGLDILVIDDGSSINKIDEDALIGLEQENLNISYLYLKNNMGIEHALNAGLYYAAKSKYKYIARLDCGDTCAPDRFFIQKNFLDKHNDVGIVGSYVKFYNLNNELVFNLKLPTENGEIKKKMYLNSMFIHPSIMFRADILDRIKKYPVDYKAAEDYAFFFEILKYYKGANIDQYLVNCEINPGGLSVIGRKEQVRSRIRLIVKHFRFGLYPIYGLVRNIVIYLIPYRMVMFVKSKIR